MKSTSSTELVDQRSKPAWNRPAGEHPDEHETHDFEHMMCLAD